MTFNTGNPVGSTDARDLYDNAQNLDKLANGPEHSYQDRLGVPRKSIAGMEADFTAFLAASGFEPEVLEYVDGSPLTVLRPTQLIERTSTPGILYAIKLPATFPAELSGNWTTDEALLVIRVDDSLRKELMLAGGPGMVGFSRKPLVDAVASTLEAPIASLEVSIWEFEHLANKAVSPWDWTAAAMAAYASLVTLGGGTLRFPAHTYAFSGTGITTLVSDTYYRATEPAIRFQGDGFATVFTRGENQATDTPDRNAPADFHQAIFNIHNSNNVIEDIRFADAKTAIYMGHKAGENPAACHASMNRLNRLWIHDCGFGIHIRSGLGVYYNSFQDVHVWQCQVGQFLGAHPESSVVPPNTNRNQFRNIRNARCHIGLWLKKGDTNQFIGHHNEGNTLTPTNNRYPALTGLPGGLVTGIGQLVEVDGTNNQFIACMQESCETELYNAALYNSFSGLYRAEKCVFVERPIFLSIRDMAVTDGGRSFYLANVRTDAFAGYPAAVDHTINGRRCEGISEIGLAGSIKVGSIYSREYLIPLGPIASGASSSFSVWDDSAIEASTAGHIELSVIGNSQTNNLALVTSLKISALRNSSRTLTRFFAYDIVTGRAIGAPAGDSTEPFAVVLSTNGSRELIVTITAPARTFESVLAIVKRTVSQP